MIQLTPTQRTGKNVSANLSTHYSSRDLISKNTEVVHSLHLATVLVVANVCMGRDQLATPYANCNSTITATIRGDTNTALAKQNSCPLAAFRSNHTAGGLFYPSKSTTLIHKVPRLI
jgi:hypothetical protein